MFENPARGAATSPNFANTRECSQQVTNKASDLVNSAIVGAFCAYPFPAQPPIGDYSRILGACVEVDEETAGTAWLNLEVDEVSGRTPTVRDRGLFGEKRFEVRAEFSDE
jgi:hypothetical protein